MVQIHHLLNKLIVLGGKLTADGGDRRSFPHRLRQFGVRTLVANLVVHAIARVALKKSATSLTHKVDNLADQIALDKLFRTEVLLLVFGNQVAELDVTLSCRTKIGDW